MRFFRMLSILLSDSYKQFHFKMYPEGLLKLYSNGTPRSFKHLKAKVAVFFGLQYYIKEYLISQWTENFFNRPLEEVIKEYKRFHKHFSGVDNIDTKHIEDLHRLGFLPIRIKALPEGSKVKEKVPFYTIINTIDGYGWLVNFLETQMSTVIWHWSVIATIGNQYSEVLNKYALETTGSTDGVKFQGHDFSMRGLSSMESTVSQLAWLLFFYGTDTIPAVLAAEMYYNANIENELVGTSVPASEHSVMTSYGKEEEINAFRRLMKQFPKGILSIVSDSFDLWKVLTKFMVELKDEILARDGKIVIRPDSGDPVDIICGELGLEDQINDAPFNSELQKQLSARRDGVIELLWYVFGGTINEKGYKVLSPKVGAIYGDSINLERATAICERLKAKGFASTNVVFGVGSYTMNMNSRDSIGFAVKSTWCEVKLAETDSFPPTIFTQAREIFKDPITDDGTKKSAKGLLAVYKDENGEYFLEDQCTWEQEESGDLAVVFEDGFIKKDWTLAEVRAIANS